MPEIDLKKDATGLLGQIAKMKYDPATLEMQFMKGIVRKIDCPKYKVTEGNIKYLELILWRAMQPGASVQSSSTTIQGENDAN